MNLFLEPTCTKQWSFKTLLKEAQIYSNKILVLVCKLLYCHSTAWCKMHYRGTLCCVELVGKEWGVFSIHCISKFLYSMLTLYPLLKMQYNNSNNKQIFYCKRQFVVGFDLFTLWDHSKITTFHYYYYFSIQYVYQQ